MSLTKAPTANQLRLFALTNAATAIRPVRTAVRNRLIALNVDPTGDFGDLMPTDPDTVDINQEAVIAWVNSIDALNTYNASGTATQQLQHAQNAASLALLQRFASCLGVSQAAPALDLDPLT